MNFTKAWLMVVGIMIAIDQASAGENLLADPSFEQPKPKDRWGAVFTHWGGWIYEGQCEFRVSNLARTGNYSLLIVGRNSPKIRAAPSQLTLEPGRYRVTAYLRGLDIGTGVWNQSTEFMFEEKYLPLRKNGTFGWTRLSYVGEVKQKRQFGHPSFGLMAPGYLWVDDVSVERVGEDVPLTPEPVLEADEQPIQLSGALAAGQISCVECGYRNMPAWGKCYACGTELVTRSAKQNRPNHARITSFEEKNPFSGGKVVPLHATDGTNAVRLDGGYLAMDGAQDWTGFDYLKVDVYTPARKPLELYFEVRDASTTDYWTRVNYTTIVPPGASTLIIPTALYVGEKSRPGRPLILNSIQRVVFSIGDKPEAPLFLDNLRLERDTETEMMVFDGLWAFDIGPGTGPVMEGFTALDMGKAYSAGRGYGWKNARFWRAFDALQPDPLYQDFICVEQGGLAIDVPNGRYHVMVNMDSPSGFWGEFQRYRRRALILEGVVHEDRMSLEQFKQRYYRFWDTEDLPGENTFDKYQQPYFDEKEFAVEVKDGQLNIEFSGENWACAVSAVVVYPVGKEAEGKKFLEFVEARRRFHFDNYFKRVLPDRPAERPVAADEERARGFIVFTRDWMQDVSCYDVPQPGERAQTLSAAAFAGEYEPVTFSVFPLRDLGRVTVKATALNGPGMIPAESVQVNWVSYRLSRITMEGTVYGIAPRLLMPANSAPIPENITRSFWLTVKVPTNAAAGLYRGTVQIASERGGKCDLPLELKIRKGSLDAVDIPVGPWGHTIDLPWFEEESGAWNRTMAEKSLKRLRDYGFTSCSGLPVVTYKGFRNGVPELDFSVGDAQMRLLRANGFTMPVVSYCAFGGLNTYYWDEAAMKAAGLTDYSQFIKAVFGAVHQHAQQANWLPVYWNLGDEPLGDDLVRSAENAEAYRKAFPDSPPFFTGASSFQGTNTFDPHFRLSRALHVANWNLHDAAGVKLVQQAGGNWGFYNGGNRWTYGIYLYKAAKEHGMKFRLSWHWNVVAGDPYYALDCREDDYAWCNSSPSGELIPSVHFEQLREGLDDYRRMLTLDRMTRENVSKPEAQAGRKLLAEILSAFQLGEREIKSPLQFNELRDKLDTAIERLAGPSANR